MLGEFAIASVIWQRPQMPRPPQTESMSTPSWRAAVSTGVPTGKRPRLPEGVKTTRASVCEPAGLMNSCVTLGWIDTVRPSRRPLRGLLRMRQFLVQPKLSLILRSERSERLEGRKMLMQP